VEPTRLRPLQVGEILDAAIKVYRARFKTLVKTVAIVVAPVEVLALIVQISAPLDGFMETDAGGTQSIDPAAVIGSVVAFLVVGVLGWLAAQFATAASLKVVSDSYLGQDTDWRTSLAFARQRLGSLVSLAIIYGLLLILGFLACVVPGVYFLFAWSVAIPALLIEDKRGLSALRRSRELVQGRWWPVFACIVISMILSTVISSGLGAVFIGITFAADSEFVRAFASGLSNVTGAVLVTPFSAAVTAIVYFDLRVRKEGFDLELLAQSMGTELPPELAPPQWGSDDPTGPGGVTPEQPPFWPPPPGWRPSGG
jgi:hypothetical protein